MMETVHLQGTQPAHLWYKLATVKARAAATESGKAWMEFEVNLVPEGKPG